MCKDPQSIFKIIELVLQTVIVQRWEREIQSVHNHHGYHYTAFEMQFDLHLFLSKAIAMG